MTSFLAACASAKAKVLNRNEEGKGVEWGMFNYIKHFDKWFKVKPQLDSLVSYPNSKKAMFGGVTLEKMSDMKSVEKEINFYVQSLY